MSENLLEYRGLISFSQIDTLLTEFKLVSQQIDLKFSIHKKIITVMIEALENVTKYQDKYKEVTVEHKECLPVFKLDHFEDRIQLQTSNPVINDDIGKLKDKINLVNSMSKAELKELYVNTITDGKFSSMGGAGLGFIEMARTSGNTLQYDFSKINEKFAMYTFIVTFCK